MTTDAAAADLDWLFGRLNFERLGRGGYSLGDLKLERMRRLLAELGDPQLATPCVHVAGSKGKGSVVHAVDAIARAGGYRVGRFTSPHIDQFHERIAIDGEPIGDDALHAAFAEVRPAVERLDADDHAATFFEIGTALAWVAFAAHRCDLAVMEVGLGGRLDSTNLCRPLVTAIVSISRDHGQILGHGLDQIAREKAGIIKRSVPVVVGELPPEAMGEVARVADEHSASVWAVGREIRYEAAVEDTRSLEVTTPAGRSAVRQTMAGQHQSDNLAVAVAIAHRLRDAEPAFDLPDGTIASPAAAADVPLRIETVSERPRIVLDVAHNGASVEALLAAVPEPDGRSVAIFGTSNDKHVDEMLAAMRGRFDAVCLTEYSTSPRALPIGELAAAAAAVLTCRTEVCPTPAAALDAALDKLGDADELLIFGSFFLASEIRSLLAERRRS